MYVIAWYKYSTTDSTMKYTCTRVIAWYTNLLLNLHCVADDSSDPTGGWLVLELLVHEAGKVAVESFVSTDELVGEGKTRHESSGRGNQNENGKEST